MSYRHFFTYTFPEFPSGLRPDCWSHHESQEPAEEFTPPKNKRREDEEVFDLHYLSKTYDACRNIINSSRGLKTKPEGKLLLESIGEAELWLSSQRKETIVKLRAYTEPEVRSLAKQFRLKTRIPLDRLRTVANEDLGKLAGKAVQGTELNEAQKRCVDKVQKTLVDTQRSFEGIIRKFWSTARAPATSSGTNRVLKEQDCPDDDSEK